MSSTSRFPGVRDGWARFDGPAGTQMVDTAIAAMAEFAASGHNANCHGAFDAADRSDEVLDRARASVARLLGAPDPQGIWFGANMTTMTMAFTRAVERTLRSGDRVVGTRLDHDANVTPWHIACARPGVTEWPHFYPGHLCPPQRRPGIAGSSPAARYPTRDR